MQIIAQRQWLAACVALAFVACGGDAKTKEAGAGSGGTSAASSSGGAQTEPSSEVNSAGAGASDAAGASSDAGAGGAVSDAAAEAAGAGALANGGAHAAASAGAAGKAAAADGGAADGGAPNTMSPSGGTHFCEGAEDCSNALECRGRGTSVLQVCLAGCTDDADCAATHRCVMPSDPLGPDKAACFLRCDDSPLVCPYAFDCYDISGQRDYTCLPRQW